MKTVIRHRTVLCRFAQFVFVPKWGARIMRLNRLPECVPSERNKTVKAKHEVKQSDKMMDTKLWDSKMEPRNRAVRKIIECGQNDRNCVEGSEKNFNHFRDCYVSQTANLWTNFKSMNISYKCVLALYLYVCYVPNTTL